MRLSLLFTQLLTAARPAVPHVCPAVPAANAAEFYAPRLFMPDLPNRPQDMPYNWGSLFGWVKPILMYKEPDVSMGETFMPL